MSKKQENKVLEEETQNKGSLFSIGFFLLLLFISFIGFEIYNSHSDAKKELSDECIRLGYENLTDYNMIYDYVKIAQIECDNKVLWNECYNREVYEWDKWGDKKIVDRIWKCND